MRAFLVRVLLLCCGMTSLAAGALLLGRSLPEPALVQRWHLTDCAPPCWLGITPGETPVDEAVQQLAQGLSLPSSYPIAEFPQAAQDNVYALPLPGYPSATTVAARLAPDAGHVASISFPYGFSASSDTAMPRIGDIVTSFGLPTCVDPWPSFGGWSLFYVSPEGVAQVAIQGGDTLSWMQPVYFLHYYTPGSQPELGNCRTRPADYYPWLGLNRLNYQPHLKGGPYQFQLDVLSSNRRNRITQEIDRARAA